MKGNRSNRRGYALMMVLVFSTLMVGAMGVTYQKMASHLRVARVMQLRLDRDEGSLRALAQALAVLETGAPPTTLLVRTLEVSTTSGPRTFRITFTLTGSNEWEVRVVPATPSNVLNPLPTSFAVASLVTK